MRKFDGGIFRVTEPTKTVIHVHGGDSTDQLSAGSSGGSVTASGSQHLNSTDAAGLKAGMGWNVEREWGGALNAGGVPACWPGL